MMGFWKRLGWNIALTVNQAIWGIGDNVEGNTKERIAKEDDSIAERIFSSPARLRRNFTVDNVIEVISHYSAKEQRRKALIEARKRASDQGGEAAVGRLPLPGEPSSFWSNLKVSTPLNWQALNIYDVNISHEARIAALARKFADASILSEQDFTALTKRIPEEPGKQNQQDQNALLQLFELAYAFPNDIFPRDLLDPLVKRVMVEARKVVEYPGLAQRILRSKIIPIDLKQELCDYFINTAGVQIPETLKPDLIPYTFSSYNNYLAAEQKNIYRNSDNSISEESKEFVTRALNNKNTRQSDILKGLVEFASTYYTDLSQQSKDALFSNALRNTYTAEKVVPTNKLSPADTIKLYLLSVSPDFFKTEAEKTRISTILSDQNNTEAREAFLTILNDLCSDASSYKSDDDVKRMTTALSLLDSIPILKDEIRNTRVGLIGFRSYKYENLRDESQSLRNVRLIKFYLLNASPQFFSQELEAVKALLRPSVDNLDNTAARRTFLTILNDLCSNKTSNFKDDNDIKRMEIALSLLGKEASGADKVEGLSREATETRSGIFGLGGYKYEALRDEQLRNEELIRFYLFNASPQFFAESRAKATTILSNPDNTAARQAFLSILNDFYSNTASNKNDKAIKRMGIALSLLDEMPELKNVATTTHGGFLGLGYQFEGLRNEPLRNEGLIKFYLLNATPQFIRENQQKVIDILSVENNTAARQTFLRIMDDFYSDANPDKPLTQSLRMEAAFSILKLVPSLINVANTTRGFLGFGYKYADLRERIQRLPINLEEVPPQPPEPAAHVAQASAGVAPPRASDAQPPSSDSAAAPPRASDAQPQSSASAAAQPRASAATSIVSVVLPDTAELKRVEREKLERERAEREEEEEDARKERAQPTSPIRHGEAVYHGGSAQPAKSPAPTSTASLANGNKRSSASPAALQPQQRAGSSPTTTGRSTSSSLAGAPLDAAPPMSGPPSPPQEQQQLRRQGSDSSLDSRVSSGLSSAGSAGSNPQTPRSETEIPFVLSTESLQKQEASLDPHSKSKLENNKTYQEILRKLGAVPLTGKAVEVFIDAFLTEINAFKIHQGNNTVPNNDKTLRELIDITVYAGNYIASETALQLFLCQYSPDSFGKSEYPIKELSMADYRDIYSHHKNNPQILPALFSYLASVKPEVTSATNRGPGEVAALNLKYAYEFAFSAEGSEFGKEFFQKFPKEGYFTLFTRVYDGTDFERFKTDKALLRVLFSYLSECVKSEAKLIDDEHRNERSTIQNAYAYAQTKNGSAVSADGSSFAKEFYILFPRVRYFKLFHTIYDKKKFDIFKTDEEYLKALFSYLSECVNPKEKLTEDEHRDAMMTIQNAYAYAQSSEGYALSSNGISFANVFYNVFPRKVTSIRPASFDDLFEKVNDTALPDAELKILNKEREEFFNNLTRGAEILIARKKNTSISRALGSDEIKPHAEKVTEVDIAIADANHSTVLRTLYSPHSQKFADYLFKSYDRAKIFAADDSIVGVALALYDFNPNFAVAHIDTLIIAARNSEAEAKAFVNAAKSAGSRSSIFAEKLFSSYENAVIIAGDGIIKTALALDTIHPSKPSFVDNHIGILEQAAKSKTAEAKEFVAIACTRGDRGKQFADRLFSSYGNASMCASGIIETALAIDAAHPSNPTFVEKHIDILEQAAKSDVNEAIQFVGLARKGGERGKKFADRLFSSYENATLCASSGIIETAFAIDVAHPSNPTFVEKCIDILEQAAKNNAKEAKQFAGHARKGGERGKKFADRLFSNYQNALWCGSPGIIETALKFNSNDNTFAKRHIQTLVEAAKNNEDEARQFFKSDLLQTLKYSISTEVVNVGRFDPGLFFIPVKKDENPLIMKFSFRQSHKNESESNYSTEKLQIARALILALNCAQECSPEQLESLFIVLPNVEAKKALEESLHANGIREGFALKELGGYEEGTDSEEITTGRYYDIPGGEINPPARLLFPKPHNGSKELFDKYAPNHKLVNLFGSRSWSSIIFAKKLIQETVSLCEQLKIYISPEAKKERVELKRQIIERKELEERQRKAEASPNNGTSAAGHHSSLFGAHRRRPDRTAVGPSAAAPQALPPAAAPAPTDPATPAASPLSKSGGISQGK